MSNCPFCDAPLPNPQDTMCLHCGNTWGTPPIPTGGNPPEETASFKVNMDDFLSDISQALGHEDRDDGLEAYEPLPPLGSEESFRDPFFDSDFTSSSGFSTPAQEADHFYYEEPLSTTQPLNNPASPPFEEHSTTHQRFSRRRSPQQAPTIPSSQKTPPQKRPSQKGSSSPKLWIGVLLGIIIGLLLALLIVKIVSPKKEKPSSQPETVTPESSSSISEEPETSMPVLTPEEEEEAKQKEIEQAILTSLEGYYKSYLEALNHEDTKYLKFSTKENYENVEYKIKYPNQGLTFRYGDIRVDMDTLKITESQGKQQCTFIAQFDFEYKEKAVDNASWVSGKNVQTCNLVFDEESETWLVSALVMDNNLKLGSNITVLDDKS